MLKTLRAEASAACLAGLEQQFKMYFPGNYTESRMRLLKTTSFRALVHSLSSTDRFRVNFSRGADRSGVYGLDMLRAHVNLCNPYE